MAKTRADLSQLTKAILKESTPTRPVEKPAPEPSQSREDVDAAADERIAELERQLAEEREAHEAAVRERDRLLGECGRLQGELRKRGNPICSATSSRMARSRGLSTSPRPTSSVSM